jgi:hypothetical protein
MLIVNGNSQDGSPVGVAMLPITELPDVESPGDAARGSGGDEVAESVYNKVMMDCVALFSAVSCVS